MTEYRQVENETVRELARRTAMLQAVAFAATQIVTAADWRHEIPELLRRLGLATDMSRVTLFEVHDGTRGEMVQSCRFDWAEPGLESISTNPLYQNMNLMDENNPGQLGDWPRRRQRGEVVQATLRDVTGYTRQVFLEHGTLSFLSVPIMVKGAWWGFLGFDDCKAERVWGSAEIDVLKAAAGVIAAAIERERSLERLSDMETKRANLARYFSPNIVDDLMQSGGRLDFARSQIVTVLFVDIIGFTRVSASMTGVRTMALLREYLAIFEDAVFANGGTLDKFLGDGLMATFGTPKTGPQDATNAVRCACLMGEKIVAWNAKRIAAGLQPLRIGIGLHHGEVVLGDIGGERRVEFAVIGDTVNVANRIEAMTRQLDIAILASQEVIDAVKREDNPEILADFQDFGLHALRGREGKIRLWGRAVER
jgi:class 3 adenylate cyclase